MKKILIFSAAIFSFSNASADEVRYEEVCDKITSCAVEQMKKEADVPPEMIEMMTSMFAAQCGPMMGRYTVPLEQADLTEKANACLDSFKDMSCDELMANEEGVETQACKDFEKAAEAAGVDLEKIAAE